MRNTFVVMVALLVGTLCTGTAEAKLSDSLRVSSSAQANARAAAKALRKALRNERRTRGDVTSTASPAKTYLAQVLAAQEGDFTFLRTQYQASSLTKRAARYLTRRIVNKDFATASAGARKAFKNANGFGKNKVIADYLNFVLNAGILPLYL